MPLGFYRRPFFMLLVGVVLVFLSYNRWSVGIGAWGALVPFLVYLAETKGVRSRLLFLLGLCAGFSSADLTFITPPLVWPMGLLFGLATGVSLGVGILVWERYFKRVAPAVSHLAFAAVLITVEWLLHRFTPLGSMNAAAYTQMDNLPFLQAASLFGIAGIGFVVYWSAALLADIWVTRRASKVEILVLLSIIFVAHGFGACRLGEIERTPHVTAAAVSTDFDWMGSPLLPEREDTGAILSTLLKRSEAAASSGARVVAWPEVSAVVESADEAGLIKRIQLLAKKTGTHVVPAYLRLLSRDPLRFENKAVWIDDRGRLDHTYRKHYPVPLEPSVAGKAPVRAVETRWGTLAAAICYDFDFPSYARQFATAGVDLVVLPSSENLGMEHLHPRIAAVRAIEGGYSILRPARLGRATGIDPRGRLVGWTSDNAGDEKLLRISLPVSRRWTLYTHIGDLLVYLAMGFLGAMPLAKIFRKS